MKVSIIITNYNYGRFLGRAVQSCLAQQLIDNNFEVIVVDDASADNSARVLESYGKDIKVICHEKQKGLPAAVNTGLRAARGLYVMRLDADDWLDRHICFIFSYFMDHNKEIGFVWPDYYVYDQYENVIDRISKPQGAGVMFRKQLLVDVGLYDEEMLIHEDKDILFRCIEQKAGYHLKLPLYRYYRHDSNLTNHIKSVKIYKTKLVKKHGKRLFASRFRSDPGHLPSQNSHKSK